MKIVAVILHYRNWPTVRRTLDAVLNQTRPPDALIVMDHASGDGSPSKIREAYSSVEIVILPTNTGPAAGFEQVIRAGLKAGGDAVLSITDDAVPTSDALEHLERRLLEDEGLGAVTPLTVSLDDPQQVIEAGGYVVPGKWHFYPHRQPETVDGWTGVPPIRVDTVGLGFTLLRAQAARAASPYPKHYYHWADDADFSLQMKSLGWSLECVPAVQVAQHIGYPQEDLRQRNWLELIYRNAPRRYIAREVVRTAMWIARDGLAVRSPERRHSARMKLKGLLAFTLRRFGAPSAPSTRKA